ncbi:uroporphyrinogen-III synthase [Nitrosospira sp. Nsp5]|uniref:Uroporphyrinogen-III synthase n=1 Tax=Nitrosospira multiformis TaxID=1231 RepID=A0ABY0T794_9PROT|nr:MULTISPECIES: uroporphyrinogen-III synthase [Nitrosospira]PTR06553.1 uroporphyrinogen-III synthase [Nitrosospira sp. Nsp5]SDQ37908.1 uroporphyrinogen-III synthase [Nitrosospira multiformis]
MSKPLTGISILVTRPAHQADGLAARIRSAGGNPVLFPLLEILDIGDQRPLLNLIARLDEFDLAIFISPNAVNKAMSLIRAKRSLPPALKVAAVGQGTTRALGNFGVTEVIAPALRFDSEALLEMTELQHAQGKRVVIFRGDSGRELLGNSLLKRGAMLEYAECYRRVKPGTDTAPLLRAGARGEINAITITSSEGLRNLFDMVGEQGLIWLRKTPLFVSHERIAQTARKLGLDQVILTAAGDEGLLQGLLNYFQPEASVGDCPSRKP